MLIRISLGSAEGHCPVMSVCDTSGLSLSFSRLPTFEFRSDPFMLLHSGNTLVGLVSERDSGVVEDHKLLRQM